MNFDLAAALRSLRGIAAGFLQQLPYIVVALLVFALFYVAARLTRKAIRNLTNRRRKHQNVGLVLGRLAEGGLMLAGALVALVIAIPSFQPSQLIQLLGISSVAIGFAFREILQNFLAGILILLTEPFRLGDQIVVGSYEGTVEEIETRATFIRTYDGRRVVIPNSNLFTQSVTVNTAFEKRRLQYDVGIGYGDDVARAQTVILEALGGVHGVLRDPAPEALVVDLAGSSVNLRARWWINPPLRTDVMTSMDEALHAIRDALTKEGIDLPFPTRQVLFHDRDRRRPRPPARRMAGRQARGAWGAFNRRRGYSGVQDIRETAATIATGTRRPSGPAGGTTPENPTAQPVGEPADELLVRARPHGLGCRCLVGRGDCDGVAFPLAQEQGCRERLGPDRPREVGSPPLQPCRRVTSRPPAPRGPQRAGRGRQDGEQGAGLRCKRPTA